MTLPLITPQGVDFLKNFPGQNSVNLDRVDAFAGPSLVTHPLQTYTPQLIGGTANPNLGPDGYINGFYYRIFDQVFTWGQFRFGTSGIAAGTGTYIVTLPFDVAPNTIIESSAFPGGAPPIGTGATFDDSLLTGSKPLTVHLRTPNTIFFSHIANSGLGFWELRDSGLMTWAINDGVSWFAQYKRAS